MAIRTANMKAARSRAGGFGTTALSLTAVMTACVALGTGAMAQQAQPRPAQPQRPAQQPAAPAQQQAPAQQPGPTIVNLLADGSQQDWIKICGKDPATQADTCYVTRDFVAENNTPVLAVAVYETKGQPQRVIRLLMPLTFLLQPGIRIGVDAGQPVPGRYSICFPNGCFAEVPVTEAVVNTLKKGTNMTVQAQNQVGREVSFVVPLAGFAKGYDGPAVDPQVIAKQQEELQKQLQQRADEQRQRLQQGAGTPAPVTPPKP